MTEPICKSCCGCKFLYGQGYGYSNWTWMDTVVLCALDLNPNLKYREVDEGSNWSKDPEKDNLEATATSRCERYSEGNYITLDVDGDDGPEDHTSDPEAVAAICEHSGRKPHGNGS